ncbi:MAG: Cytidylate kinase [Bacteroidetes bacterium]|nr:Cytidylate kinase [Bacteroidota bacterium]
MSIRNLVIAIDGPAASGKSTTARLAAKRLGYLHVDTGAMYRAVTLKVLMAGLRPDDEEGINRLIGSTRIELRSAGEEIRVILDGHDVTDGIRTSEVTRAVSAVSRFRRVRERMVEEQRRIGNGQGIVLEGRDIGTVVFPNADLKVFLVAGIEARAKRRQAELRAQGVETDMAQLVREIEERDRLDSTRMESPLRKAPDAVVLDTSNLTIDEQVEFVVQKAREILQREN